jgi:hypothetical protein
VLVELLRSESEEFASPLERARGRHPCQRWRSIAGVLAILATGDQAADIFQWTYRPVCTIESRLGARLQRPGTLLVAGVAHSETLAAFSFQTAIIYALRRRGYRVVAPSGFVLDAKLGTYYSADQHPPDATLVVEESNNVGQAGGRLIARGAAWPRATARPRATRDHRIGSARQDADARLPPRGPSVIFWTNSPSAAGGHPAGWRAISKSHRSSAMKRTSAGGRRASEIAASPTRC